MAIELRHLRHVIAVAETGQLTRAAARLHIAQPALSQSIARVERDVGFPLFERHPHGVSLTAAGEAFVEHARRAVVSGEAAVTAARQQARSTSDRLVFGFLDGGPGLADALLKRFATAHPEIEVIVEQVSFARQADAILDGTVDAAVLCPGPPDPNLASIPIGTPGLVVFVAETHRLASRESVRFADIDDETYLSQAPDVPDWWIDIWWLTKQRGRRPKVSRRSSRTVNESIAGVLTGEVVVVSPDFFVPPYPIPGITAIPLVDVAAPNIELVYQPSRASRATQLLAGIALAH